MFAKAEVSIWRVDGKGPVSKLILAAVGKNLVLCWLLDRDFLHCLINGPLYKAAWDMAASCPPLEQVRENKKRVPKMKAIVFL